MASLGLEPEEFKAIEQLRTRLWLLTNSIESLQNDILNSRQLPTVSSLQASRHILHGNLKSLVDVLGDNADLFHRLVVRPSGNFPGAAQENVLTSILRKKLEPDVEEWTAQGRDLALSVEKLGRGSDGGDDRDGLEELRNLWVEARAWSMARIQEYIRGESASNFTKEEIEAGIGSVRTGLKRDLVADEEEEEEDEEEEEEDGGEDDDVAMADASAGPATTITLTAAGGPATGSRQVPTLEPEELFYQAARADFQVPVNVIYESRAARRGGGGLARGRVSRVARGGGGTMRGRP